jgi:hypothetical protein
MRKLLWILVVLMGCGGGGRNDRPATPDAGSNDPNDVATPCVNLNVVEQVPLEVRIHIPENQTPIYRHNPPVAGEHYPIWARWRIHEQTVPRGYWVHNLEHGGVVFLYRPDAPRSLVESLTRVYNAIPNDPACNHRRVVVTADPLLDVPWAVTVSGPENSGPPLGYGYSIKADCIQSEQALIDFAVQHRDQGAEHLCDEGSYP